MGVGGGGGWRVGGEGGGLGRTIQKNCCLEKIQNLEKKDILGNYNDNNTEKKKT